MEKICFANAAFGQVLERIAMPSCYLTPAEPNHCEQVCNHAYEVTGKEGEWLFHKDRLTIQDPQKQFHVVGTLASIISVEDFGSLMEPIGEALLELGECLEPRDEYDQTGQVTGENAEHFTGCSKCQEWLASYDA